MSYLQLFKLILNPWCSTNEIRQIAMCGRNTAIKIRNNIESEIQKSGKMLPKAKTIFVPTQKVVEYLGLDLDYIKEMAKTEEQIIFNNRTSQYASISRQENKKMVF